MNEAPQRIGSEEHIEQAHGLQPWDAIESVSRKIKDPEWYKPLFGGKSKENLDQEKISPDLVEQLVQNLERGRYIGPLETQPISWSDTKIYRDIVQNFFDGMKDVAGRPTLDGIEFSHKTIKAGNKSRVEFTVNSPAEYDHRYLLHHGGTTKAGDESVVGGFGEGLKIASFLLLKNGVTKQVELGSDHWRAYYYLNELPSEEYPEKVRGLYLKGEFVKDGVAGNFLKFNTDLAGATKAEGYLEEMKGFFWHEGHQDFQNPTFENDFGGFKLLPRGQKGNLYVAGQRHEYNKAEAWSDAVPGAHAWTFKKVLERTRDRNYAENYEVKNKIIIPLIDSMGKSDLLKIFHEGSEYWTSEGTQITLGDSIMSDVVYKLGEKLSKKEKSELLEKLPDNLFVESDAKEYNKMLEQVGFRLCISAFSRLGVPNAKERIAELVDTAKEPELESWENLRLEILSRAIQVFIESVASSIIYKYSKFLKSSADKPMRSRKDDLFWDPFGDFENWGRLSASHVISCLESGELPTLAIRETGSLKLKDGHGEIKLHGFTKLFPKNIFLQRELLRGDFLAALFTWAHEFAHNISGADDFEAGFTDAERYLHELLLITSFQDDKLKKLQEEWDAIK